MAISKPLIVSINRDKTKPNEKMFIYRNDIGVDMYIELTNLTYEFDGSKNFKFVNALFKTPSDVVHAVNNLSVVDGRIKFSFNQEVVANIQEIGKYELQFQIFDKDKNRLTIPSYFFEVKEPLGNTQIEFKEGIIDFSCVDYSYVSESSSVDLFAVEDGYIKTNWRTGDLITSERMNNIEDGIEMALSRETEQLLLEEIELLKERILHLENLHINGGGGGGGSTSVSVQSVSLTSTSSSIAVGGTATLTASISPSNATNKNVTWSTNNSNVTLTPNGLSCTAVGVNAGSSVITVTTADGQKTATYNMRINALVYGNIVTSLSSATVNEGQTTTFTVKLDKAPTNNQTVTLSVDNGNCTINKNSLTFTPSNYNTAQTVTVTGVRNSTSFENLSSTITISSANVSSKTIAVTVQNTDSKVYGNIVTSLSSVTVSENQTTTFTVRLDKAPTENQVVSLSVNNSNCTLNKTSLTFTPSNYNTTQSITITGTHNSASSENLSSTITLSSANVSSKTIAVTVQNTDSKVYGNIVTSLSSTTVDEGRTTTFTVRLDKAPTNNQTVTLSVDNGNCTINKTSLTFTPSNYNTAQSITITGTHNLASFENLSSIITLSSANVPSKTIAVTVQNTDSKVYGNIVTSPSSVTVDEGQTTTFTVRLDKAPTNNQVVSLSIDNNNCTIDKTSLTFTPSNYNTTQTVTVTGVHNTEDYSNITSIITLSSANVSSKTINVTVRNIDTAPSLGRDLPPIVVPTLVSVVDDDNYELTAFNDANISDFKGTNVYFVSPNGDDSKSGTSLTTALKTLNGAIAKIDALNNPTKATVLLEDGEYPLTSRVNLRGTKFGNTCQVDIRGIGNNATFTGAETLDNSKFTSTTMNGVTVYQYDLSSYNLNYTFGNSTSDYGDTMGNLPEAPFIIMDGKKSDIASYPSRYDLVDLGRNGSATSSSFTFTLPTNMRTTIGGFSKLTSEVFLHCYYQSEYFCNIFRITNYDSSQGRLTMGSVPFDYNWTDSCCGVYISNKGMKARFLNVKEQLKNPNEYYIDYTNKKLYVIPPSGTSISNVKVQLAYQTFGTYDQGVFYGTEGSDLNIVFERVNFDGFRSKIFKGGLTNTKFYKCIFKNSNSTLFDETVKANNIEFRQCKFGNTNGWGIKLDNSGTRTSTQIVSGNVKIYNCIFNNIAFNNSQCTYMESIYLGQMGSCVGAEVRGNKLYLNSGMAIIFGGNDNVFDDNIFDSQCYESGDAGALYSGRNWTFRGNVISNNLFKGGHMYHSDDVITMGIYLDDMMSSANVTNNVIKDYPIGMMLGGGRDHVITNNEIYGGSIPISFDARGLAEADLSEINGYSREVDFTSSVWTSKYPAISTLKYSTSASTIASNGQPYGNTVMDNIAYDCKQGFQIDSTVSTYNGTVSNNVVHHSDDHNYALDFKDWQIDNLSSIEIITMSGNNLEATVSAEDGLLFAPVDIQQGSTYTFKADECNVNLYLYDSSWSSVIEITSQQIVNGYVVDATMTYAVLGMYPVEGIPSTIKITNFTIKLGGTVSSNLLPNFENWQIDNLSNANITTRSGNNLDMTIVNSDGTPFVQMYLEQGTTYTFRADECNIMLVLYDENWDNVVIIEAVDVVTGYTFTPTRRYAVITMFSDEYPYAVKITNLVVKA